MKRKQQKKVRETELELVKLRPERSFEERNAALDEGRIDCVGVYLSRITNGVRHYPAASTLYAFLFPPAGG